jgi:hypothetical protein
MRPYRLLRRALSTGSHRGKQIPVGYLSQEDLAGGHAGRQFAKPAMLATGNNGDLDLYILTRGSACLHYRLPSADTGFYWFHSMLGGMLPPLLRLRFEGRSHYLFKQDKWCQSTFSRYIKKIICSDTICSGGKYDDD